MKKQVQHTISGVFVFLLLGIFAVFGTVMVLLGAKVYRSISEVSGFHNQSRITSSYLRSMVRADDETDTLFIEELNGTSVITMRNVWDDEAYVTKIYVYDGMLREWFASEELPFEPENGEEICAAEDLQAELEPHMLNIRIMTGGVWRNVNIALRAGGEVAE